MHKCSFVTGFDLAQNYHFVQNVINYGQAPICKPDNCDYRQCCVPEGGRRRRSLREARSASQTQGSRYARVSLQGTGEPADLHFNLIRVRRRQGRVLSNPLICESHNKSAGCTVIVHYPVCCSEQAALLPHASTPTCHQRAAAEPGCLA